MVKTPEVSFGASIVNFQPTQHDTALHCNLTKKLYTIKLVEYSYIHSKT